MPPNVQQFLWRVGASAIATKKTLFKRACAKYPLCLICGVETKMVEHLFFVSMDRIMLVWVFGVEN